MNQIIAFTLSLVIVIIVFVVSAVGAGLLADLIGVWKKPIIGSVAAFCVVITGYTTAPSHKKLAAITWLIVGAVAAWVISNQSYYPEDNTQTYLVTLIPLAATYLSGLVAALLCIAWHKKQN